MSRLPSTATALTALLPALALAVALSFPAKSGASEADFDQVMAEHLDSWAAAGMDAALLEQVSEGAETFANYCAVCHGDFGEGGSGYAQPIINTRGLDKFRTAQRLFLYNRDMMPFNDPGSLPPEEVWQVTAWLMAMNGWLEGVDGPLSPENAREVLISE